jgi:hypothetical protein
VLSCGIGNHSGSRRLPGGAEGIRTGGHRGRGEISSWIGYENDIVEVMDNRPDLRALLLDPSDAERVKTKKDLRQPRH